MPSSEFVKPEWAERITRLREIQKLSQAALAKRLNVSPMAPSRWERGINEPSSEIYMQLGKMAGDPDCWYFWQRGGLSREDISNVVSGFGAGSAETAPEPIKLSANGQVFEGLPLVIRANYSHPSASEANQMVAVPPGWCPNPRRTICLQVKEDGMAPIVGVGFVIAVDTSINQPSQLQNALVAVLDRDDVLLVRCLTRYGDTDMLIAENRRHEPIAYNNRDWRILGKVLWWIGHP